MQRYELIRIFAANKAERRIWIARNQLYSTTWKNGINLTNAQFITGRYSD